MKEKLDIVGVKLRPRCQRENYILTGYLFMDEWNIMTPAVDGWSLSRGWKLHMKKTIKILQGKDPVKLPLWSDQWPLCAIIDTWERFRHQAAAAASGSEDESRV
jgi:hypothetical protein